MKNSAITPELEAEFQEAVRQAMSPERDPEAMRRAAADESNAQRPIVNTGFETPVSQPSVSCGASSPE